MRLGRAPWCSFPTLSTTLAIGCRSSLLDVPVPLAAGWSTMVSVQWSGRRSGTGCSSDEPAAGAGTYTVKLGTLGGEPGEAAFSLQPEGASAEADQDS